MGELDMRADDLFASDASAFEDGLASPRPTLWALYPIKPGTVGTASSSDNILVS